MRSNQALRTGLILGTALSLPLWLLLNACVLSVTASLPVKDTAFLLPAALAAICLAVAIGPVAAWRNEAASARDGMSVGLGAGLAAAAPVLVLVVPGATALALGVLPLLGAGSAVPLRELAWPVVAQTMWAAPLFALMPVLWLALVGSLGGAAFGLAASVRRIDSQPAASRAVVAAS